MAEIEKNYIVFDCDTGSDDAWALLALLKAEQINPEKYKLLGITCVHGNSTLKNVTKNTIRLLDAVNRLDIPVYQGCYESILPKRPYSGENPNKNFHGADGFGDLEHAKPVDMSLVQKQHAVNAMYEFASQHTKKVSFILVGPLTNFATCINMYQDFADIVKDVYIMGGNYHGIGNATSSAEFNFYKDPEAAHIVFEKLICPITIVPIEACLKDKFFIPLEWRLQTFSQHKSDAIKLLNRCETKIYSNHELWNPCDAFLTAAYLFPDTLIKKQSFWKVTVEINGLHTRGQMVLDHLKFKKIQDKTENVRIIEEIYSEKLKEISLWAASL